MHNWFVSISFETSENYPAIIDETSARHNNLFAVGHSYKLIISFVKILHLVGLGLNHLEPIIHSFLGLDSSNFMVASTFAGGLYSRGIIRQLRLFLLTN
jgi:hypothetical protein